VAPVPKDHKAYQGWPIQSREHKAHSEHKGFQTAPRDFVVFKATTTF